MQISKVYYILCLHVAAACAALPLSCCCVSPVVFVLLLGNTLHIHISAARESFEY